MSYMFEEIKRGEEGFDKMLAELPRPIFEKDQLVYWANGSTLYEGRIVEVERGRTKEGLAGFRYIAQSNKRSSFDTYSHEFGWYDYSHEWEDFEWTKEEEDDKDSDWWWPFTSNPKSAAKKAERRLRHYADEHRRRGDSIDLEADNLLKHFDVGEETE